MKIITTTLFLFIISSLSFANNTVGKTALRNEIKKRVENIIRTIDSQARVDIGIKFKSNRIQKSKIDYTNPFILSAQKESPSNDLKVTKLTANIFTQIKRDDIPKATTTLVLKILQEYSRRATLDFKYVIPKNNNLTFMDQVNSLTLFQVSILSLISLLSFFWLTFQIIELRKKTTTNNMGKIVRDSVDLIKTAIESHSNVQATRQESTDLPRTSTPFNFEISSGKDTFLKDFKIDSIHEIIMDCYWAEEDEYAAFIWSKLDLNRKAKLLEKDTRIGDYANYICNLTSVDSKYINETYYFSPYSLHSISNINLTKLVEKYNSIFHLLPKLRIFSLGLDANEKKKLMQKKYNQKDTQLELQSIKWDEFITTEKRIFTNNHVFNFESFEEENEFFNDSKLDFSLASSFPSLGWMTYLRMEDIKEILSPYSSKELATAWHGPEDILLKLEGILPEKKIELLDSYKEQIKSSKESEVFKKIFIDTCKKISSRELTDHDDGITDLKHAG